MAAQGTLLALGRGLYGVWSWQRWRLRSAKKEPRAKNSRASESLSCKQTKVHEKERMEQVAQRAAQGVGKGSL